MNNPIQKVALFLAFAFSVSVSAQQISPDQLAYIDTYKGIAVYEMDRTGIPASITLAQGILESRHGTSELATRGYNHFGIKCGPNWKGDTIPGYDDDVDSYGNTIASCFRKFQTVEESFIAHSDFLKNPHKSRYDFLFDLDLTDYKGWARGLKTAGYASDPAYSTKLINLIERYDLQQYDTPQLPVPELVNTVPSQTSTTLTHLHINNIPCVLAKGGESLELIAQYSNVSLRRLMNYNDDIEVFDQVMKANQIVFLKPKKWNNSVVANTYHTVSDGENMVSISQEYGITLSRLYQKNRMSEGMEPTSGSRIKLSGNRVASRSSIKTEEPEEQIVVDPGYIDWSSEPQPEPPVYVTPPNYNTNPSANTKHNLGKCDIYIVKRGDTLYGISRKYNLSVSALKENNNLTNNIISIGQEIVVSDF